MDRLKGLIDGLNIEIYNPVGLHIKWPRDAAFLFVSAWTIACYAVHRTNWALRQLEIEYYVSCDNHFQCHSIFPTVPNMTSCSPVTRVRGIIPRIDADRTRIL